MPYDIHAMKILLIFYVFCFSVMQAICGDIKLLFACSEGSVPEWVCVPLRNPQKLTTLDGVMHSGDFLIAWQEMLGGTKGVIEYKIADILINVNPPNLKGADGALPSSVNLINAVTKACNARQMIVRFCGFYGFDSLIMPQHTEGWRCAANSSILALRAEPNPSPHLWNSFARFLRNSLTGDDAAKQGEAGVEKMWKVEIPKALAHLAKASSAENSLMDASNCVAVITLKSSELGSSDVIELIRLFTHSSQDQPAYLIVPNQSDPPGASSRKSVK